MSLFSNYQRVYFVRNISIFILMKPVVLVFLLLCILHSNCYFAGTATLFYGRLRLCGGHNPLFSLNRFNFVIS